MNNKQDMEEFRRVLQDKEWLDKFLPRLVSEATKTVISWGYFPDWPDYVEAALGTLASRNTHLIFEHAESPIEKMWINSLHVQFLRSSQMLVVTPPVPDFPTHCKTVHETIKGANKFFEWYVKNGGSLGEGAIEAYLDQLVTDGQLHPEERQGVALHVNLDKMPWLTRETFTAQAASFSRC